MGSLALARGVIKNVLQKKHIAVNMLTNEKLKFFFYSSF